MLKVRITFTENEKGYAELTKLLSILGNNDEIEILQESASYRGRGKSIYSNKYLDIEMGERQCRN